MTDPSDSLPIAKDRERAPGSEDAENFYLSLAAIQSELAGAERQAQMKSLIDRWLFESPGEALVALQGLAGSPEQRALLRHLVSEWVKLDAGATFAGIRSIDDVALRRGLQVDALKSLGEGDPGAAVRWLESFPEFSRPDLYGEFFSQWSKRDLDAAKRTIAHLRHPVGQQRAAQVVAEVLASRDPVEALSWVDQLSPEPLRRTAVLSAFSGWASHDAQAALEGLHRIADNHQKGEATMRILKQWGQREPDSALLWARQHANDEIQISLAHTLIPRLAEIDPETALDFLDESPPGSWRANNLRAIMTRAALSNPESAGNLVDRLEGADRSEALDALVETWAPRDAQGAAAFVGSLAEDERTGLIRGSLSAEWFRVDPDSAVQWAESLSGDERNGALGAVLGAWAESDPVGAAEYVTAQGDTAFQEAAAERVVTEWGRWEPAEAAAWLQATFDDPEIRAPSYRALATQWLQAYPQAASAWIDTLPLGSDRDAAVTVLLDNLATSDPETASAWAHSLSDPVLRESWMSRIEGDSSR